MGDIVKAIEKEKEYLSYRMKGEEPFHLVDAVKECGFESLNDYFVAKLEYQFNALKFDVIETTTDKAIADVLKVMNERKTAVLFANTEQTIVWNGNNSVFNEKYCYEHNIPIYSLQTGGGTIVSTVGDLNIGICVPRNININSQFILKKFADIFRKYTNKTVEIVGNDILIDGFKVLGSSVYETDQMFVFITPVSLSEKTELIENICFKKSDKIPKYIEFMDKKTLKQEVLEWLQVHSI